MAIKGNLQELSLVSLVQIVCAERIQARLTVRHNGREAYIYFEAGDIVHMALDDKDGEEVIYELLGWENGEFELDRGIPPPSYTVRSKWSGLLLEGMRRLDEARPDMWDRAGVADEALTDLDRALLETLTPADDALLKAWAKDREEEIWPAEFPVIPIKEKPSQEQEGYEMAENLRDILIELGNQVPGFIATAVVGMDGIGIADHAARAVDVEAINAQMTLLLKLVDTSVTKLNAGSIEDFLLTTEKAYLLIRFLSERKDYYLGLAADRQTANLGNMRLYSRLYAERLSKAMPR